jgi:hypothetical protein
MVPSLSLTTYFTLHNKHIFWIMAVHLVLREDNSDLGIRKHNQVCPHNYYIFEKLHRAKEGSKTLPNIHWFVCRDLCSDFNDWQWIHTRTWQLCPDVTFMRHWEKQWIKQQSRIFWKTPTEAHFNLYHPCIAAFIQSIQYTSKSLILESKFSQMPHSIWHFKSPTPIQFGLPVSLHPTEQYMCTAHFMRLINKFYVSVASSIHAERESKKDEMK